MSGTLAILAYLGMVCLKFQADENRLRANRAEEQIATHGLTDKQAGYDQDAYDECMDSAEDQNCS